MIEMDNIELETERLKKIKPQVDCSYKTVSGVRLPVKIYIPEENKNKQTLIAAIHGGSWYAVKEDAGSWDGSWMNFQAQYYADKGFTTAVFSYRSIDINQSTDVFDLIEDCKDALRFIRRQTDTERFILMGDSAGGHLAIELGMDKNTNADIVVAANPVLDCTEKSWAHITKTEQDAYLASPAFHAEKIKPALLLMHGSSDTTVNCKITEKYCADMRQAGNDCEYIEIKGAPHAFILQGYQSKDEDVMRYMELVDCFIEKRLAAHNTL